MNLDSAEKNNTQKEEDINGLHILNRNNYLQLFQKLPAAIYSCDTNGRILFFNKAAARLWGREPEVGKDLWCGSWKIYNPDGTLLPLEDCPMAVALKECRPVYDQEIVVEKPDGKRCHVLPYPIPVFDDSGKLTGAYNMLVDITEYKRLNTLEEQNRKLLGSNVDLEKKLKLRNKELIKINHELSDFASIVSHDLKAPLRGISSLVDFLLNDADYLKEDDLKKLKLIKQRSLRMNNLISGILKYTQLGSGKVSDKKVNITRLIREVTEHIEIPPRITIEIENELLSARGNEVQLTQVFQNLIQNAVKYMDKEEGIIKIGSQNKGARNIYFVKDNGPGIDKEQHENIFKIFHRLTPENESKNLGLGLSIVKKIISNHNGEVWVKSEPGKGTAFFFSLPVG